MIHMDKNFHIDSGQIAMLEKMLTCDENIEKLASMELAEMPQYLAEQIMESILPAEHEVTPMQAKVSKWLQLLSYSAKIAFAAACAIIALFNLPDLKEIKPKSQPVVYVRSSYVADAFQFITDKIFHGGIENDK